MSSSTTIDDMSDDCLRLVFDRFTLNSQLRRLRIVSKRFQAVAEGLLATRQASIRKLKLFPNLGHVHSYVSGLVAHNIQYEPQFKLLGANNQFQEHSTILIGHVEDYNRKEAIFPQLTSRVFINLTELVLVLKLGYNFDLDQFLAPMADQLVSLTLFGNSAGYEPLSVDVLSTMTNLRRLNLFNFDLASIDVPKLAPVLSNLEHLGLYNYIQPKRTLSEFNSWEPFLKALTKAKSNNVTPFLLHLTPGVCTSLSLSQVTFPDTELASLIENRPALLANLISLHFTPQENTFPIISPFGLGLTPGTLEMFGKASFPKLTLFQTSLKTTATFGSLFRQLPATYPALVELKLGHFSCSMIFRPIDGQLACLASLDIPSLRRLNLFLENSIFWDISKIQPFLSVCPALNQITLVKRRGTEEVSHQQALQIVTLVSDEKHLLAHFEEPCAVWRKDAIQIESTRRSSIGPIREVEEDNSKDAGISRLGQLQALLGVYEEKHRQAAARGNFYQKYSFNSRLYIINPVPVLSS